MNKSGYIATAAFFYVGMLIMTAPASLLGTFIHRISHARLSLANCQGTIWNGNATLALRTDQASSMALHTLHWRVSPQALLTGTLRAELDWDDAKTVTPMALTITRDSIILTHVQLPLPAEVISELSPYLKPAQLSGNLMIDSPELTYSDGHLLGSATARWSQAGSAISAVHPLGDYQIDIVSTQNSLSTVLTTRNGALLLEGQGNWSPMQKFHFNGTASATPAARPMLSELLHYMGPETAPGIYRISI